MLYASSSLFASTAAYGADGTEAAAEHERTGDTVHIGSADKGLGTDADIFRRERWLCSAHVSAIRDAHWRDPVVSVNTTDTVSTLLNVCRRGSMVQLGLLACSSWLLGGRGWFIMNVLLCPHSIRP